jgi:acetate kinase
MVVEALAPLGFTLDEQANDRNEHNTSISSASGPEVYVIKTNESTIIAHNTEDLIHAL